MKKSKHSEEQIIGYLKQVEAGIPLKDMCRKDGVSEATFYNWRAKFGGMEVTDAKRLKELEGLIGDGPRLFSSILFSLRPDALNMRA